MSTPEDWIKSSVLVAPAWAIAHKLAMPSMVYTLLAKPLLPPWGYSAFVIAPNSYPNAFLSPGCNHHKRERSLLADVPLLPCLSRCKMRRQKILPQPPALSSKTNTQHLFPTETQIRSPARKVCSHGHHDCKQSNLCPGVHKCWRLQGLLG